MVMSAQPEKYNATTLAKILRDRRLYVSPPLWTRRHLELVGCHFVDGNDDSQRVQEHEPEPQDANNEESSAIVTYVSRLRKPGSYRRKLCCLTNVLVYKGSKFTEAR